MLCVVSNLRKLHQKRIKESFFSDDSTLQKKIVETSRQILMLIKQSESKLKELTNAQTTEISDEQSKCHSECPVKSRNLLCVSDIVRKNMTSILAERLKNMTFELRHMEKEHFAKVQEIHGNTPKQ